MGGRTLALTTTLDGEVYAAGTPEEELPEGVAERITNGVAWDGVGESSLVEGHHQRVAVMARHTPGGLNANPTETAPADAVASDDDADADDAPARARGRRSKASD